MQIVFKHLPLPMHSNAEGAALAAEAAGQQGKFWEMHDLIFANQRALSDAKYQEFAGQLGLDVDKFNAAMVSPAVKARVEQDKKDASSLGVSGTPAFFINGKFLSGAQPFPSFKRLIDQELGGS